MYPLRWLLCVFALSLPLTLQAAALQLYTEDYPPLNFNRDGKPAGLGVEVVEELLKRTGHTATISVVPWARGYQKTLNEPNSGLFVTMRTAEREKLFKWVGPIAVAVTSFYALKGSGLSIHSLDDARQLGTIAVPRQWYSYQTLQTKGLTNLYGVLGPKQMMTMLRHRRVPLVVADNLTLPDLLALGGLKTTEIEALHSFLRSYAYIAFSPDTDDALIRQWQASLEQMKADGSFSAIYQRWLPGQEIPLKQAPETAIRP